MTRYLAALVIAGALVGGSGPLHAQGQTATFMEGTSNCEAVSYWFPDAIARMPSGKGNDAGVQSRLSLFNGHDYSQAVTITLRSATQTQVFVVALQPESRRSLELASIMKADADFAVEVDFERVGAADLKVWSGNTILASSAGLALCRAIP